MDPEHVQPLAWQPLTPAGVAAFAGASFRRLWLIQLAVAILIAAMVLWFLSTNWFPVIRAAIRQLPAAGAIRSGRLVLEADAPVKLAENRFLALACDPRHEGLARSPAHLQLELGEQDMVLLSTLGVIQFPYPRSHAIACNREDLEPWWGAWSPAILALTALAVLFGLMLSWAVFALAYAPAAWLIGFFANRELTFGGSVRLCGAALMPGAVFMLLMILLYGFGAMDVLKLLIGTVAHFLIGWVYVLAAPWFCRRVVDPSIPVGNPFHGPPAPTPGP
jgi:hypothetical protein